MNTASYHIRSDLPCNSYVSSILQKKPDLTNFFRHVHGENFELFILKQGAGNFLIEDKHFSLAPNSMVIIRPGMYHMFETTNTEHPTERVIISVTTSLINQAELTPFANRIMESDITVVSLEENGPFLSLLDSMFNRIESIPEEAVAPLCRAFIPTLFIMASFEKSEDTVVRLKISDTTKRVLNFVNEYISSPINVDSIATALFLSKSHIGNQFYKDMHIGIMQYISKKKIALASALINKGMHPIEVSDHIGYADYSTFYRAFKRYSGKTPAQAKKQR